MSNPVDDLAQAQEWHSQGRLAQAKEQYLRLLAVNPNNHTVLHMLGILAAEEGQLEQAKQYLESAIKINPHEPTYMLHLANIYKSAGDYPRAIQQLEKMLHSNPQSAAVYNNLGTVYFLQAAWQQAIAAYEKAIALQPEYADAYYNLALAFIKAERWDLAKTTLQALLELSPGHPGATFQLASMAMLKEEYETAIQLFDQVASAYPHHFETQTNLATCYLKLGKLNEAQAHYLLALEIMPHDSQILFNLGVINMNSNRLREAVTYYLRAAKEQPDNFDTHNNLGVAFLALRDDERALLHFREALRIQPSNEAIRHTVAILSHDKNIAISPPGYVRSLFDSYASHYEPHLVNVLHYQVPGLIYDCMREAGVLNNEKWDILDLGCGTGLCGEIFKSRARTLIGVDLSEKMLQVAAQKDCYTDLVCADILPFLADKAGHYDLIIAGDVLVYFGNLDTLFHAIYASLRKYGYVIFNAEINADEDYVMTSSGRFAHSKAYLERLIAENDFTILKYQTVTMRTQNETPVFGHLYLLRT